MKRTQQDLTKGTQKLIESGWTWAQVPDMARLLTADVSDGARVLLVYMCWRRDPEGKLWPSVTTMATDLGLTEPSIRKRLHELSDAGLIHIVARVGQTNIYHVGGKEPLPSGGKETFRGGGKKPLPKLEAYNDTCTPDPIGSGQEPDPIPVWEDLPPGSQKPKPKRKPKEPAHVAIKAYRSVAKRYPPGTWKDKIIEAVGDDQRDVDQWKLLVHDWVGRGWNPGNIVGLLEMWQKQNHPGAPKYETVTIRDPDSGEWVKVEARI